MAKVPGLRIVKEYPEVEAADIRQALQYASMLANEEVHPLATVRL